MPTPTEQSTRAATMIADSPTAWAADPDSPIELGHFGCCGRFVCRCDRDDDE